MTELVITIVVMKTSILEILEMWPSRAAVHEDALAANPGLEMVAVHRWFQRCSVPLEYFSALAAGAERRKIGVTVSDLVSARRGHADQCGQARSSNQPSKRETANPEAAQ